MPLGKPPREILENIILRNTGKRDPRVILPPKPGEDAAAIDLGNGKLLVVHPDPITGAEKRLGTLAINVAANDIASTGAPPQWFTLTLILPPSRGVDFLETVMREAHQALEKLGASLVGGHTEWSEAVERPVAVATAMGVTSLDRLVPTGGGRPGDALVVSKPLALEATAIAAEDLEKMLKARGVPLWALEEARSYWDMISVVPEALALAERGLVNAMHDPTEGGLLAGVVEMAQASGLGAIVHLDKVPLTRASEAILGALEVDPLRSLSSGSLLAAVPPGKLEEALGVLRSLGLSPAVVGELVEDPAGRIELVEERRVVEVVEGVPVDGFLSKLSELV